MLKKNDAVSIVFPGTACSLNEIKKIKTFLRKSKLSPIVFWEKFLILKRSPSCEFPSFDAWERFLQLKDSIEDPYTQIVWCARGGYGSAELLPLLEEMPKPEIKKIFIGFSDISSLNNFLIEKWNWQVISAPMLVQIALDKVSEKSTKAILDLIFGKTKKLKYRLKSIIPAEKEINALITGGCVSVLAGQFGTKNQINWQDKILFLEDEGEDGERLDRYFHQIVQIILEQKKYPKAILLGNFLEANPHGSPKAKNIKMAIEIFARKLKEVNLGIPLFEEKSKCLGHSKNMLPLILGAEAKITPAGDLIQRVAIFVKEGGSRAVALAKAGRKGDLKMHKFTDRSSV